MTPPAIQLPLLDLGLLPYAEALDRQNALHAQVQAGDYPHGALIVLEHPPVVTVGRRANTLNHLLVPPALLKLRNIELAETDRGGDITFHGPGQLVAYPILPLNAFHLNLHSYLRLLEQALIDTLAAFAIPATRDPADPPATGVWATPPSPPTASAAATPSKIAAIGIKVRRWISLHGIALNVSTDLSFFSFINACGLSRPVTSMQQFLGDATPPMPAVKQAFAAALTACLRAAADAPPSASH